MSLLKITSKYDFRGELIISVMFFCCSSIDSACHRLAPTAKRYDPLFECLAHDLCLLMAEEIERWELRDEKEEKKAKAREI